MFPKRKKVLIDMMMIIGKFYARHLPNVVPAAVFRYNYLNQSYNVEILIYFVILFQQLTSS